MATKDSILQQAFDLIDKNRSLGHFSGEKSEKLIDLAERKLQLTFPVSYKQFLKKYGCGGLGGEEIYGLVDDDFENSCVPDTVWTTLKNRKECNLNKNFLVISDLGYGGYYILDCLNDQKVYVWEYWAPTSDITKLEVAAENFETFLLERMLTGVEDEKRWQEEEEAEKEEK